MQSPIEQDRIKNSQLEKPNSWHFFYDFLSIGVPIGLGIYLCEAVSLWFYPLVFFVICNRQVSNALMGHEGAHGLLHPNKKFNDFLGRYVFHFPALISHSRFKTLHLLHHRFVGYPQDPDTFLYKDFPRKPWDHIKYILKGYATGSFIYLFANYFTEIPSSLRKLFRRVSPRDTRLFKSDFPQYLLFWSVVLTGIHYLGLWVEFGIYWMVPVLLSIPWIQFQNALEHGAIDDTIRPRVRSIVNPGWLASLWLPKHLNYHFEHHINDRVPHYNLPKFSSYLEENNSIDQREDYYFSVGQVFKHLFRR